MNPLKTAFFAFSLAALFAANAAAQTEAPCRSGFYNDPMIEKANNYMCVLSVLDEMMMSDLCGPELIKAGYKVDFYMVKDGTSDTLYLSVPPTGSIAPRGDCTGSGDSFTCFGGIKVEEAVYSCGGRNYCKGSEEATKKVVGLTGSYNVYARLVGSDKPVACIDGYSFKPILIDQLTVSQSTPNITTRSPATNIKARVIASSILLENLPKNAKIEVYNLQGKRIYSTNSENSKILRILVQTKGMYIIKIGSGNILRVSVM